ncbi:MAG: nucleotide exchange factor GrpE [Paludibacteraceae bacterium]|jgi:molecular chaperone GrpE|nr:nucleotide exchange factor GrpE [Paludibacteraceae bacterium]
MTKKKNVKTENVAENIEKENVVDPVSEIETLKAELEALKNEQLELNDKYIRKVAEFENYRKNAIKERAELIKNGGERLLVDMLPLVDDIERALQAVEQSEDVASLKEGVVLIYNKFITFLAKNGVKSIDTENADFDTDFHEAVTMFPAPTEEQKNKIIDCVSKGYLMNDKVIRFAKVVVGS